MEDTKRKVVNAIIIVPGISQEELRDICVRYSGIAWAQIEENREDKKGRLGVGRNV